MKKVGKILKVLCVYVGVILLISFILHAVFFAKYNTRKEQVKQTTTTTTFTLTKFEYAKKYKDEATSFQTLFLTSLQKYPKETRTDKEKLYLKNLQQSTNNVIEKYNKYIKSNFTKEEFERKGYSFDEIRTYNYNFE